MKSLSRCHARKITGAMAQSGKSSQNGGNASYYQLTVGYRFTSSEAPAEAKTEPAPPEADAKKKKQ